MIPCLFICYNRLDYTKQSLRSLMQSDCGQIYVVDNSSNDGTQQWLNKLYKNDRIIIIYNKENLGIAGAMNQFLDLTKDCQYAGKVDNDTIVPENWASLLLQAAIKYNIDMVQAKHCIIPATHPQGWQGFTRNMIRHGSILYNHFIGGSGIVFRRDKVTKIPETDSKIMGWRQYQREHPELIKAFCEDVEIELLDTNESGVDYSKYEQYYKSTKRIA